MTEQDEAVRAAVNMLHHYAFKGRHTASEAVAIDGAREAILSRLATPPPVPLTRDSLTPDPRWTQPWTVTPMSTLPHHSATLSARDASGGLFGISLMAGWPEKAEEMARDLLRRLATPLPVPTAPGLDVERLAEAMARSSLQRFMRTNHDGWMQAATEVKSEYARLVPQEPTPEADPISTKEEIYEADRR